MRGCSSSVQLQNPEQNLSTSRWVAFPAPRNLQKFNTISQIVMLQNMPISSADLSVLLGAHFRINYSISCVCEPCSALRMCRHGPCFPHLPNNLPCSGRRNTQHCSCLLHSGKWNYRLLLNVPAETQFTSWFSWTSVKRAPKNISAVISAFKCKASCEQRHGDVNDMTVSDTSYKAWENWDMLYDVI